MKWIAIVLITGVVLQIFSRQVIFLEFKVNQSFISAVLCEKKAVPNNHCKGKCQLKKQLDKNSEREERTNPTQKSGMDVLFSKFMDKFEILPAPAFLVHISEDSNFNIKKGFLHQVFRPPSC